MAKDKKSDGFQSAAGLIRYFDAEDEKAIKIDPRLVVAMVIGSIIFIEVARVVWTF